ncbi:MAG: penicillin-binding protein 2 [Planctomycetota bacterium]
MRSGGVLFLAVAVMLIGGASRLAYIQHQRGAALQARAVRQQTASLRIPAQRGQILDTRGRLLAGSLREPSVFVDPSLLPEPRSRHYAACSVAPTLGLDAEELEDLIHQRSDSRFVWVKRQISDAELEVFNSVREGRRLYAFGVQYESLRTYPLERLAAHVLGFVGDPIEGVPRGLAGIELSFDEQLHGTDGHRVSTVDVDRRRLRTHVNEYVPPVDGVSVVLTIDAHVQQLAEEHLRQAVETFKAEWGIAIAMDPQTGEVLAMANVPDFEPAQPIPPGLTPAEQHQARECLQNKAIAHAYEPGSVFKPFIASCALDEQIVHLDEVFHINGPARAFGSRTIHDTHAYGSLAIHEVISRSSNIGMALLGGRCGNERLHDYVRRFGFGTSTALTLPGEHDGLVQDLSRWTSYSTQSIPIGQEIAVTGIQLVTAFSCFCNGGVLYRPRIVRGISGPAGDMLADYSEPIVVRRVLGEQSVASFRERALVEVVMSPIGTGKNARISNYRVFGKTGTAQVAGPRGGYLPGKYVGSFIGGAPADVPRVVVLVTLYKPAGGKYYGGTVSAPAVGAILADTLAYMQVPPEVTTGRTGGIMP